METNVGLTKKTETTTKTKKDIKIDINVELKKVSEIEKKLEKLEIKKEKQQQILNEKIKKIKEENNIKVEEFKKEEKNLSDSKKTILEKIATVVKQQIKQIK